MSAKTVLVTGANTGIGYEVIRALRRSPQAYQIILSGRSLEKAQEAVQKAEQEYPEAKGSIFAIQTDIESDESIQAAFDVVKDKYGHIDVLVNNAGAAFDQKYYSGEMTMRQAWNQTWDTNVTGTQVMTHVFAPLLLKSSDPRLLFLTSGTANLTEHDNVAWPFNQSPPEGWPKQQSGVPMYRSSKVGLNMMMREWHRVLKQDGVKVWSVSPGFLATALGGSQERNKAAGAGDPALGGEFIRDIIEGQRDDDVGKAVHRERVQPW